MVTRVGLHSKGGEYLAFGSTRYDTIRLQRQIYGVGSEVRYIGGEKK